MRYSLFTAFITAIILTSVQGNATNQQDSVKTADQQNTEDLEEVIVTGMRLANRRGIAIKRNSGTIIDALSTDDLAQTVDLNIADVLRRLPGVNTIFDEDEGRYVTVRGLESNFTLFTFDGIQLASVDPGSRRVNTEMIPPTAVKQLEVIKTLTPELEGNAIGGHVNLVTRSAFDDKDGFRLNVNGELGFYSSTSVPNGHTGPSPKISAGMTKIFGPNEEFGIVLGSYYYDKKRDQSKFQNINLYEADDGHTAIDDPWAQDYTNEIARRSLMGKFEFKPSDAFHAFAGATWFDYQYDEVRYRNTIDGNGQAFGTGFLEGSYDNGDAQHRVNTFPIHLTVKTYNSGFEYRPNYLHLVEFDTGYSVGTNDVPGLQVRWTTPNSDEAGFAYSLADGESGVPRITVANPSFISDLSNYTLNRVAFSEFNMREDVFTIKGAYGYNMEADDGIGFKVGGRYRELDKIYQNEYVDYRPSDGVVISGEDFISTTFEIPLAGYTVPISDYVAANEFRQDNINLFDVLRPDGDNIGKDFDLEEDVKAIFGMVRYASGPLTVIGGLRYEKTETNVRFFSNSNGVYEQITRAGSYSDMLPSVTVTYELDENKRIRAAYSQALGRPDFSDLAGAGSVGRYEFLPPAVVTPDPDDNEPWDILYARVRLSNANLEPRRSDNFDIAFDWFIGKDHFFSVAGFHKNINGYIFDATQTITDLSDPRFDGLTLEGTGNLALGGELEVIQPINTESAKVTGVEVQYYRETFDFLPGFLKNTGLTFNATLLDGSVNLPSGDTSNLIQQPNFQMNASLLYTKGKFEGRLAFAHRSRYINSLNIDDTTRSRFAGAYSDLNVYLRYDFTNKIIGKLKIRNLTNKDRINWYGESAPELGAVHQVNSFGRSVAIAISYKY